MGTIQKTISFIITALILFLFWIIFSGKFDSFHLILGVISSLMVALFTYNFFITTTKITSLPRLWLNFAVYFPWIIWQIFLSNIHLLKIVFSPNIIDKIDPHIIKFKSNINNQLGLVTFANSITLTPGTITVSVSLYGEITVHAINKECAKTLPGEMGKKVKKIFE